MGNSTLRREASKALKRAGYGKLYVGKTRKSRRYLHANTLRHITFLANLRPGDLVNDCDGFNHRIKEINVYRNWTGIIGFQQLLFEDGGWSCGCPYGPDEPWTPEQIIKFHNLSDEDIQVMKDGGWWSEKSQKLIDRIRAGESITDKNGIKLEF